MRLAVWFLVLHTVWALPLQQNTRETAENEELQYSSQSQHNADYEELETGVQPQEQISKQLRSEETQVVEDEPADNAVIVDDQEIQETEDS